MTFSHKVLLFFSVSFLYHCTIAEWEAIDISHENGKIDWSQMSPDKTGINKIIVKASQGGSFKDPNFADNILQACRAGFNVGAYHSVTFSIHNQTKCADQYQNFIEQIHSVVTILDPRCAVSGSIIFALGIGENDGSDYDLVESTTRYCVNKLAMVNIKPYIYTTTSFWNQYVPKTPDIIAQLPLWIARYRNDPPSDQELPNGWTSWSLWQYTQSGNVTGINGNVNRNKIK